MAKLKRKKGGRYRMRKRAAKKPSFIETIGENKRGILFISGLTLLILFLIFLGYFARAYHIKGMEKTFDRGFNLYHSVKKGEKADFSKALLEFQKIVNSYGGGDLKPLSYFYIGTIYYKQKDYKKAVENYKKVFDYDVDNYIWVLTQYNLAKTYEELGNLSQAERALNKIINDPRGAFLRDLLSFDIAIIYERMGQKERALTTYQKILDNDIVSSIDDWVLERMNSLKDDNSKPSRRK